jgi:hypothetical protein
VARIATGYRDLINAVILRAVQDALGKRLAIERFKKDDKKRVKNQLQQQAIRYILKDEDFFYLCECAGKDYTTIRNLIARKEQKN